MLAIIMFVGTVVVLHALLNGKKNSGPTLRVGDPRLEIVEVSKIARPKTVSRYIKAQLAHLADAECWGVVWSSSNDANTCDSCYEANGRAFKMAEAQDACANIARTCTSRPCRCAIVAQISAPGGVI